MALLTQSYLKERASKESGFVAESNIRTFSSTALASNAKAASFTQKFDIFLSHSFEDAILIEGLRDELVSHGFSVYVDWIEDPQLDRSRVTKQSAAALRGRMLQSSCLLFATSEAAKKSLWMPWELGYMDAYRNSRVAIAPIVQDQDAAKEFKGQEYLGLYPYLDKTLSSLYIHDGAGIWVTFREWLAGNNPRSH